MRARKDDMDGAIEDWSEAVRLKPDFALAFSNRGLARRVKGDIQGAISDFQKYLDLGGGVRGGDQLEVEKAIRDLRKALSSKSKGSRSGD